MYQKNNLEILLVVHVQIFHMTDMIMGLLSTYAKTRNNKRKGGREGRKHEYSGNSEFLYLGKLIRKETGFP